MMGKKIIIVCGAFLAYTPYGVGSEAVKMLVDAGEWALKEGQKAHQRVLEAQGEQKDAKQERLRRLQFKLDQAKNPPEALNPDTFTYEKPQVNQGEVTSLENQIRALETQVDKSEEGELQSHRDMAAFTQQMATSGVQFLRDHQSADAERKKAVEVAAVKATIAQPFRERILTEKNNRDRAEMTKRLAYASVLVPVAAAAIMAAYFGIRHYYQPRPTIIERDDTSIRTLWEKIRKIKTPCSHLDDLVLEKDLEQKVKAKFVGIEHAIRQHLPLSNMMFYGPAGTGKTMAAQEFARYLSETGIAEHIIIRGPAFKRIANANEAVDMLAAILRWAKKTAKTSKKPVVLVFDEAETLFADREQPEFASKLTSDLVTTMTSFLGSAISTDVMFILSTNFPSRIDKALRNRIAKVNRIRFTPPGQKQLEDLLKLYLEQNFTSNGLTVSPAVQKDIKVFAEKMHGLVGRDIQALTAQPLYQLISQGKTELTPALLHEAIRHATETEDLSAY